MQGKTLFASSQKLIPQVIGEAFRRGIPPRSRPYAAQGCRRVRQQRETAGATRPACADTGRIWPRVRCRARRRWPAGGHV